MEYVKASDIAPSWGVSERSVRNYCAQGRVEGAVLRGKTWLIPADAKKPMRVGATKKRTLLNVLRAEKAVAVKGGIYHRTQIDLAYNSNHIEGSTLSHEQTRHIFETKTIGLGNGEIVRVDDIIEASNHFRAFDYVLEKAHVKLSGRIFKDLHRILKQGTSDAAAEWFRLGGWKAYPNEVGGRETTAPEDVDTQIGSLISSYESADTHDFDALLDFHVRFERIHPFQDGNGRVGRLALFKECLRWNIIPFVITDGMKLFYYRGLSRWDKERGWLRDNCLTAQDSYAVLLDRFRIEHSG